MRILGLQKLTLLDYPGKVACSVFTGGCNMRCPFCHNASLVLRPERAQAIGGEEIFRFLEKRRGLLEGVCVTGGEPLLQRDIRGFMGKLKDMGYAVKLDTNGSFPDRLRELVEAGLVDYVAMDIKGALENYGRITGVADFDTAPIRESAEFLLGGGLPYEFRTTVVRGLHRKSDFEAIGRWLAGARRYYLQGFVDSDDLIFASDGAWSGGRLEAFGREEMEEFRQLVLPGIPGAELRGL